MRIAYVMIFSPKRACVRKYWDIPEHFCKASVQRGCLGPKTSSLNSHSKLVYLKLALCHCPDQLIREGKIFCRIHSHKGSPNVTGHNLRRAEHDHRGLAFLDLLSINAVALCRQVHKQRTRSDLYRRWRIKTPKVNTANGFLSEVALKGQASDMSTVNISA